MPFPPAGQSCATCYVWDDRADFGDPGVMGLCRRGQPRLATRETWKQTQAGEWCFDGLDKSTQIPYTSPISGGSTVTIGNFTATAGSTTAVTEAAVTPGSSIQILPTNADAVTLLSFVNLSGIGTTITITNNAGVGFSVNFGVGVAAGTETFSFQVIG